MNKPIIPIIIILIIAAGIGGYFIFQKSAFPEPQKITPTPPAKPEFQKEISKDSPFGIMAAFDPVTLTTIRATDKVVWAGEKFRDLGAKWSRGAGEQTIWGLIEPEFGKGYDWSNSDKALKKAYENGGGNFNMVVVINPQIAKGGSSDIPSDKEDYYSKFVEELVERYDGDGINDYNSIIKVKYWQMANEPFPRQWENAGGTVDGYVRFAELTHDAIKKSDPNAKIILGTFQLEKTEEINKFKEVIPKMKNKNLFDYVDTHYWNFGNNYKIPVGEARNVLDSNGYSNAKMVALEFGTWMARSTRGSAIKQPGGHNKIRDAVSGRPAASLTHSFSRRHGRRGRQPSRESSQENKKMTGSGTEKDQAAFLIKGYAYNMAHGVFLINWNNLVEWNNFGGNPKSIYNFMGLIADGVNGDPIPAGTTRLSYYTYKKMTEILEGSDWDNIGTIQESGGVYIYKFTKQGESIWVVWNDNSGSQSVTISGINSNSVKITEAIPKYDSGKDVTNYNTAFNTETKTVPGGTVTIILSDKPVFVEEK